MASGNAVVVNFSGGETSPRSRGRLDQPWYQTSAKKMSNFIAELQGPARFRPGFQYAFQTRLGQIGRIIDFEINDNLAYLLEFTPGYLRVRNPVTYQLLLTSTAPTITSITKANPAVVTVASAAGLANGQEVVLSGVTGMPQLNNMQFVIGSLSGNTFQIKDSVTGTALDTSAYPTAATAGTASVVYELATPYSALDLQSLQVSATDGRMYLVCPRQLPQKLTVDAYGVFTIGSYSRVNDPFALAATALNITRVQPWYTADQRLLSGTITPASAAVGTGVNFTASLQIFSASDGGKYIWLVCAVGETRYGVAKITGFTSTTVVVCTIVTAFDSTTAIPAGDWNIVTVETLVTFSGTPVVNASLSYLFASVGGATQANGNSYLLVPYDTVGNQTRFLLRTSPNASVDSSAWGTYTTGGTATPTSSQPSITVTGITLGTKTVVTFLAGASINPNVGYKFSGVVGTTQINGNTYWLKTEADGVHITLVDGTEVDSSAWSAYVSGGTATAQAEYPLSVAFYEGRLVFGGTNQRPDCLFLSRSPDNNGNSRYDDFTGGTAADYACFFQLAPTGGSASFISWARGGPDYLFIGSFGGPYRVSGSGLDIPITPTSINVRQFDTAGCEETMPAGLQQLFFIQRAGVTVRSIKVINPYLATFESADLCLNAEQVGYSSLQRIVLQHGRPDCVWAVRADGKLFGMSVKITQQNADTLTGWHPHKIGGSGLVQDIAIVQRQTGMDQVWIMVQRVINGATRCFVEVMADDVYFPDVEDYFASSGAILSGLSDDPNAASTAANGSKAADLTNWKNAIWRRQDEYIHMDAAVTYDGSARGVTAGATLTPSAVGVVQVEGQSAVAVTLTASAAVFLASDVGSEIWVKPDLTTGLGAGRAKITAYTSPTVVSAVVSVPFSSTAAVAAGNWYFAISTFYGLGHLEGQTVSVLTDGAVLTDGGQTADTDFKALTVSKGTISIPQPNTGVAITAAVAHVGLPYLGFVVTHNLELGGRSGPAQSKTRNISEINARFLSTLGVEYGTDLYDMQKVEHRLSDDLMDRPAPVFSGIRQLKLEDSWSGLTDDTREKHVVICQRLPLPAVIEALDIWYDTADEGAP